MDCRPAVDPEPTSTPRRRAKAVLFVVLTTAMPLASFADALDDLRAFASQTRTAKGSFTQSVTSRSGASLQPSMGEFVFARPGRFRWTYSKPFPQVLVADGQRLWIYDPDLNQVSVRSLDNAFGGTPAALLFGSSDFDRSFDLRDAGLRDGLSWLEATPKNRDTLFEKILIGFRNGEPVAMELRDTLNQTTALRFGSIERNPRVDAATFSFTPPKGADVLQY